jgi:hypothetical protein
LVCFSVWWRMSTFRYATLNFFSTGQFLEPGQQSSLANAVLFG